MLLYDRVIKAVYKTAWTDNAFSLDCGAWPLKTVRQYRSAEWLQTHLFMTSQAKGWKLGTNPRHAGASKRSCEHMLVDVWGIRWHGRLFACASMLNG